MTCFHPLSAWQTDGGEVVFAERGSIRRALTLPCGQCVGCRLERSRRWAMRCVHESQMHDHSSFVTLTYDELSCPVGLEYSHFQKFMKRTRRMFGPVRFFMCGEYGEIYFRPHYHALLFGLFFSDRVLHSERGGFKLYRSDVLSKLWPHGFASIGDVTFESAAYTARYCMKKVTGDRADDYYKRVDLRTGEFVDISPEFAHMSLKPGIGATWFARYRSDVFGRSRDGVIINGVSCAAPRYYREYLDRLGPDAVDLGEDVDFRRYLKSGEGLEDRTEARLLVREKVAKARLAFFSRTVE